MGQVYAVTSGKGGVGKSTVSVGLAASFCKIGKKVLLVDMDQGLGCLDLILGVDETVVFNLADIMTDGDIENSVYTVNNIKGLELIPATDEINQINPEEFSKFAEKIAYSYDVVIFDFPAGIDFSLYSYLPKKTVYLTVAVFDPVSVRDAAVVNRKLSEISPNTRLIINKFQYKLCKNGTYCNIDDLIDGSGMRLLGIIPLSDDLSLLSVKHNFKPKCKAAKAFLRIVKRLNGEEVLLPRLKKI